MHFYMFRPKTFPTQQHQPSKVRTVATKTNLNAFNCRGIFEVNGSGRQQAVLPLPEDVFPSQGLPICQWLRRVGMRG
ncbi:unnamed protein product [Parnassius apollo]|uniref:(apollo) hypothetical protein n=1 Tax=Parnassius apollo TaxID=110799 RepID=A0A8S3W4P2_PARAO|nr:unnamed protein product [Parnassius apollo]